MRVTSGLGGVLAALVWFAVGFVLGQREHWPFLATAARVHGNNAVEMRDARLMIGRRRLKDLVVFYQSDRNGKVTISGYARDADTGEAVTFSGDGHTGACRWFRH